MNNAQDSQLPRVSCTMASPIGICRKSREGNDIRKRKIGKHLVPILNGGLGWAPLLVILIF